MSFITKNRDTMYKDERNQITLNKDLFAFASDFNDVYFANDLNWKKLAVHFKHSASNQTKIIVLFEESNVGWFEASALARTGVWEIQQIQVFDKDGDMDTVLRATMPSPENFDIVTARKVAPSELIVSVQEGPQRLLLGAGKTTGYEVGFKVRLWDESLLNYLNATIYTITDVTGDVVTLDQVITGHAGKTLRLKFPNFADASPRQKGIYQFVGSTF